MTYLNQTFGYTLNSLHFVYNFDNLLTMRFALLNKT